MAKELYTRRKVFGLGVGALTTAMFGPLKEPFAPQSIKYGYALDRIPQHLHDPDGPLGSDVFREGSFVRYIDQGNGSGEAIDDRFTVDTATNAQSRLRHSGIYFPLSYLERIPYDKLKQDRPKEGETRWFEISINKQEMWAYSQMGDNTPELKWNDTIVTGRDGRDTHTRIGNWVTYRKRYSRWMAGGTGRARYSLKFVGTPVYFYSGTGQAFHNADWRTEEEYGKQDYHKYGSHGCANCRRHTAEFAFGFGGPFLDSYAVDEVWATDDNPGTPTIIRDDKPNYRPR